MRIRTMEIPAASGWEFVLVVDRCSLEHDGELSAAAVNCENWAKQTGARGVIVSPFDVQIGEDQQLPVQLSNIDVSWRR